MNCFFVCPHCCMGSVGRLRSCSEPRSLLCKERVHFLQCHYCDDYSVFLTLVLISYNCHGQSVANHQEFVNHSGIFTEYFGSEKKGMQF